MQSIILSRRGFREFDQIISLYTLEKGKQEVIARGVKKITSKNSPHLEPGSLVDIEIVSGKEIDHLTKVQPINYFVNIRTDLQKSLASTYIINLTDKLVHSGERDEKVFELLKTWLEYINSNYFKSILIDAYIIVLLYCLGFDILDSNIDDEGIKKYLQIFSTGNWEIINNLEITKQEYNKIHKKIYNYLVYQTERKVEDWDRINF